MAKLSDVYRRYDRLKFRRRISRIYYRFSLCDKSLSRCRFSIEAKEVANIVDAVRKRVKKRKIGNANRLVYDGCMPLDMLQYICDAYDIPHGQCIRSGRYLNLEDLSKLPNLTGKELSEVLPSPMQILAFDSAPTMFEVIRQRDFLIHFPYQSFSYLTRFLTEAADNPNVTDIKLTQYRVAENSEIIDRLLYAAQKGKQVTVYVEIKARFDEENNIITSELMRKSGIRVVYSTPGLKVHAKALLIKCSTLHKISHKLMLFKYREF